MPSFLVGTSVIGMEMHPCRPSNMSTGNYVSRWKISKAFGGYGRQGLNENTDINRTVFRKHAASYPA